MSNVAFAVEICAMVVIWMAEYPDTLEVVAAIAAFAAGCFWFGATFGRRQ